MANHADPAQTWETYVICFTDKYCGSAEILEYYSQRLARYRILKPLSRKMNELCVRISGIHKVLESQNLLIPSPEFPVPEQRTVRAEFFCRAA